MGCTPSLHVSPTGVVKCRGAEDDGTRQQPGAKNDAGATASSAVSQGSRKGGGLDVVAQRVTQELRFGPMRIKQPPPKVLLVFSREDPQSDALTTAASKLGFEAAVVRSGEAALAKYDEGGHDIVFIDNRHSKAFDAVSLCRSIRNIQVNNHTVVVAVVKKSYADKEEATVLPLLNAGFNRLFLENSSLGVCCSELLQLEHGELRPRLQLSSAHALFSALSACRDLVHITDADHTVQFVNAAAEHLLGYSSEERIGAHITEVFRSEQAEVLADQLTKGKEWTGTIIARRKTGDTVVLHGRVFPGVVSGRSPTHFIYVLEPPPLLAEKSLTDIGTNEMYPLPRGSLKSLRKGSCDIKSLNSDGSQIIRRQSLAKIHSLTIEAPITKVINIICAAQENSPVYVAQALEKVLEILRTTELYSPQLLDGRARAEDPHTADLLGALLSQAPKPLSTARRSSSEAAVKSHTPAPRPSLPTTSGHQSAQLKELLDGALTWEFDIIRLEELTIKRPLVWLGMTLMTRFNVHKVLGCDEVTLQNWLTLIEANYHSANSYHNSTHAADVLQATAVFLEKERLKQFLDDWDCASSLIAAAVHDVDHPGRSSQFLCSSGSELAILYNDLSVLESHHAAISFKLTMSDERVNILKALEREQYKTMRQSIIDMVLATEMTKHFEHLAKFVNVFTKPLRDEEYGSNEGVCESPDVATLATPENVVLIKRMLIKCADVSNPTRPLKLCVEWARRIAEEYFAQTDEEKAQGLPVVMPLFDRSSCSIPKSQIGFIDYFISDMFEAWEAFVDMPELLSYMTTNYQYYKEKDQQGIKTIEEIQELVQVTLDEREEVKGGE